MASWKKKLIWIAAILAGLFIVPFFIPMSSYVKQAETLAAEALGVPVSIGTLRIALLPSPRLNATDIVVGEHEDFSVDGVSVVPALITLFADAKVISSIRVNKPVIKKSALDIVASLSKQPKSESSITKVSVRQISINDATLVWPGLKLPEINADITLTAENMPEAAVIESVDGKLKLDLVPEDNQQSIIFSAKTWTLPAGPPFVIDALRMDMTLTKNKLNISKIDGALYGGKVNGSAILTWDKVYKLSGKTKLNHVAVQEPVSLMTKSTRVSGRLISDGRFSAVAKTPATLLDNLQANIKFNVNNGVLYGFDLAKAPLMLIGKGVGGETKFDEFSGLLGISGKTYRFQNLKISSGLMSASGAVRINPNKTLRGQVEVEVKGTMQIAAIPLQVSGTLSNPTVFPTKAAIAGAVAGTAALGPVGTGLGLKAGKAVDELKGLFGGEK